MTVYLAKFAIAKVSQLITKMRDKRVNKMTDFITEVRNEHYAKLLESADMLDIMDEQPYNIFERHQLKSALYKDRINMTRKFEFRIIQVLYEVDSK